MSISQDYGNVKVIRNGFAFEQCRLDSFSNSSMRLDVKERLALTGFYSYGSYNACKCYFCGVEVDHWNDNDDIILVHLKRAPLCPLLNKKETSNVPIIPGQLERLMTPNLVASVSDWLANNNFESIPTTNEAILNEQVTVINLTANLTPCEIKMGTQYVAASMFPAYSNNKSRLSTFSEWPISMPQSPASLSIAGFFYTGRGDMVRCFSCGGRLKNWIVNSDPWTQHALNFEKCVYLTLMKGVMYITEVRGESEESPI